MLLLQSSGSLKRRFHTPGDPNFSLEGRDALGWSFVRADPLVGLHHRSQLCLSVAEKLALNTWRICLHE